MAKSNDFRGGSEGKDRGREPSAPVLGEEDLLAMLQDGVKGSHEVEGWDRFAPLYVSTATSARIQALMQDKGFAMFPLDGRGLRQDDLLRLRGLAKGKGYPDMAEGLAVRGMRGVGEKYPVRFPALSLSGSDKRRSLWVSTGFLRGGIERVSHMGNHANNTAIEHTSPWLFWRDRG